MGTMMLTVEWFIDDKIGYDSKTGLNKEGRITSKIDPVVDKKDSIVSHMFILDAEGLGIAELFILENLDEEGRQRNYRKRYGGLGGTNIDLKLEEAIYLVNKYRQKNIWYKKDLPEGFDLVYKEFYSDENISIDENLLFSKLCKSMESEYEFINYMLMRFIARDKDALFHYSSSDLVAASHISQINGALLYNTIEKKTPERYLCRAIYEDIDGYYDANIIVNINSEGIEENSEVENLLYYDKVKKYTLRSFMVLDKKSIYDYEVFDIISKSEIVDIYDMVFNEVEMTLIANKIRETYPGIQELAYENGILFTQYYKDNSHLDSREYLINNDLMFNIFLTEDTLYLACFDEDTRDFVGYVLEDNMGREILLVDSMEFEQNVLFDFIESGSDDFYDFIDN